MTERNPDIADRSTDEDVLRTSDEPADRPSDESAARTSGGVAIRNWGRYAVFTALVIIGLAFLVRLHDVLVLFYLATLLALAINPAILWLERRRFSRTLAVILFAVLIIAGGIAAGSWIIPPAVAQLQALFDNLPEYYDRIYRWIMNRLSRYPELRLRLTGEGNLIRNTITQAGNVVTRIGTWAYSLGTTVFSAFLIFFLVFFGLLNPRPMASALFHLTPTDMHDRLERTLSGIQDKAVAWVRGSLILMTVIGVVSWIGLSLLNIPQALLFGIIAGFGEGIPTIGPILSAIPPIVVTLITDPAKALWVALLFLGIQQLENSLLVPLVMGNRLNVHPWGLVFMMLVMGDLFGIVGVFLATPTTAILGVIYAELLRKPGDGDPMATMSRIHRVIGGVTDDESISTDPEPSPSHAGPPRSPTHE